MTMHSDSLIRGTSYKHAIWYQKSPPARSTATLSASPSSQKITAIGVHILSIGMYPGPNDPLDMKAHSDDSSFVDRDMIIRNLPDLGVGHVYGPSVATVIHTAANVTLAQDI